MSDDADSRAQAIARILAQPTDRWEEADVLSLLREAVDLDAVLCGVDLDRLIEAMDDHLLGPKHRAAVLSLLTRERVAELSIPTRAALISALASGPTPKQQEQAIHALFVATRGTQLTQLKNILDRGADHRDLQHIVHRDIDDRDLRSAVLAHFQREAETVEPRAIKILSDIDDTFYANWKDERFPAKTVYPGVRQLYRELDRGAGEQADADGDLVFVTARPGDRPGLVECKTHARLRELGLESATVLAGSILSIFGDRAIASGKLENFREYVALFPEYDFVFIGDSGQGDAEFGAQMLALEPQRVRAVWIHDVVHSNAAIRARWAERGVSFFNTYVGAAKLAASRDLIQPEGMQRVIDTARLELEAIEFPSAAQREARRAELEADIGL